MAVCEIWDVRGRLDHPIDYAENPEKTANPKYTEADLQAMVAYLEEAGYKMASEVMVVPELNITWVHALDPDGVHIELMQFLNRD